MDPQEAKGSEDKQTTSESVMETELPFHCNYCDLEIIRKMGEVLLPGLATACVDNTTGGIFKSPATVAVDMRKEMVDYLTQRSETFVAEVVIQEDDPDTERSERPTDILEDFIEDFVSTKRNFFSRVSGWLLSESREDKIDDFVQEMEANGFWLADRRESVSETLLRNVDYKNAHNCEMKFGTEEELIKHQQECNFRSVLCSNEGCGATFCAVHMEKHDGVCPYKVLPCEQKCPESIPRCEMDKHCITVCPMKLGNCPFYQVGCQSSLPVCTIDKHCSDSLKSHVLSVLRVIYKGRATEEELEQKLLRLEKSPNFNDLPAITNVRGLTSAVKQQEANILA